MERDASHSVPLQVIQRLAIELHALDESSLSLGHARTHDDRDHQTFEIYRELLTERLLQIAAALRTKFYQGHSAEDTRKYLEHTGFLEVYRRGQSKLVDITFKDICDKIIHAESITRDFDSGHRDQGVLTILVGTSQSGSPWRMAFSMALFAEAVLNWARDSAA